MEPDLWFMVAWMVGKHGADAPRIAEEIVERLRREQAARVGAVEESDVEAWLAIHHATVEWLDQSRGFDEAVAISATYLAKNPRPSGDSLIESCGILGR
jgi:hypothetical protein